MKIFGGRKYPNVHNSNKTYNLELSTREEESDFIKVNSLNEQEVEQAMDELRKKSKRLQVRDENQYVIFHSDFRNHSVVEKLLNHAGETVYYTESKVPKPLIQKFADTPMSYVMYQYKPEYSEDQINNMFLTWMATTTVIDIPAVIPDVNPYDVLFSLCDIRYNVDIVKLSFPPLREQECSLRHKAYYEKRGDLWYVKPEKKFEYMEYLREDLAIWGMALDLVCDDIEDMRALVPMIQDDNGKFPTPRVLKEEKTNE